MTYSVKGNRTAADVVAGREEAIETGYTLEEAKIAAIEVQKTGKFVAAWIEEEEAKASPRFNRAKLAAVVAIAKTKTADRRWLNTIDRAAAALTSNSWIVTELAEAIAVTTESGQTYFANGVCQCKAFELGQPCKHRGLCCKNSLTIQDVVTTTSSSLLQNVAKIFFATEPKICMSKFR